MVYYRKYRPQKISELDLTSVREKLSAILSSKELPHAFLFTGSKGLGKTSTARILAKAINCLSPKGIEPCNICEVCISITNGSNIDVLEIDAASNGGVEEIRTLRERVKFAPATLKKKVYIIDEVHMLSTGAFNALLKTLEEPPSHVVFILATTELWKLPPTVVSRTFQIKFELPTKEELIHSLERVVKGERLKVEDGVLAQIFTISEGSFRDGAKIFEELSLTAGKEKISMKLFDSTFKTKDIRDSVFELLSAYKLQDAKKGLEVINRLYEGGADFKVVIERLVDHLRGLLMLRNQIPSGEKDVNGLTISNIRDLLELANEAYAELRLSVIPQLPLELMTVKYCVIDAKQNSAGLSEPKPENINQELKTRNITQPVIAGKEEMRQVSEDNDFLPRLIKLVNQTNKPAAALLRSCKTAVLKEESLIITTPFPIHADRLKSENVLSDLRKAVQDLFGKKIEVRVEVIKN